MKAYNPEKMTLPKEGEIKGYTELRRNSIGVFRLLWQAMGTMSIAADAAYLLTGVALFALGATPLSILLGIVFYLFIMNTGYQFSKYVSSSGSYYSFTGNSLGGKVATFQGWNMIFYSTLGYSGFGFLGLAAFITLINPVYSGLIYWLPIVIAAALVAFLFTWFGIRVSTEYQIIGGLIEVIILIVGSSLIILRAGPANTLLVFTTRFLPGGVPQLFYSMIYSVVLFFGTTLSITSLAEETREPTKAVGRALVSTVVVAGGTLLLVAYAFTVGYGPTLMGSFAAQADPGLVLFKDVSYILFILLIVFTINSFMGYNVSVSNGNARIYYRFAKDKIIFLPEAIGKVHRKIGSPAMSALFVFLLSLIPAIIFGLVYGPEAGGLLMLYANAYSAYTEHIIASVGLPFYMKKRRDFKLLQHLVFPALAIGVLGAVIFFSLYPAPPAYPYNLAAYIGIGWIPISALMTFVEWKIHPERIRNAGQHNSAEQINTVQQES